MSNRFLLLSLIVVCTVFSTTLFSDDSPLKVTGKVTTGPVPPKRLSKYENDRLAADDVGEGIFGKPGGATVDNSYKQRRTKYIAEAVDAYNKGNPPTMHYKNFQGGVDSLKAYLNGLIGKQHVRDFVFTGFDIQIQQVLIKKTDQLELGKKFKLARFSLGTRKGPLIRKLFPDKLYGITDAQRTSQAVGSAFTDFETIYLEITAYVARAYVQYEFQGLTVNRVANTVNVKDPTIVGFMKKGTQSNTFKNYKTIVKQSETIADKYVVKNKATMRYPFGFTRYPWGKAISSKHSEHGSESSEFSKVETNLNIKHNKLKNGYLMTFNAKMHKKDSRPWHVTGPQKTGHANTSMMAGIMVRISNPLRKKFVLHLKHYRQCTGPKLKDGYNRYYSDVGVFKNDYKVHELSDTAPENTMAYLKWLDKHKMVDEKFKLNQKLIKTKDYPVNGDQEFMFEISWTEMYVVTNTYKNLAEYGVDCSSSFKLSTTGLEYTFGLRKPEMNVNSRE